MMDTINLDPPEDFLDARQLNALIERWLITRTSDGSTVANYRHKTSYFVRWWEQWGPVYNWRLTRVLLEKFEIYLRDLISRQSGKLLSWHTRHDALRHLRQMFHWAFSTNRTGKDYSTWVPSAYGAPPDRTAATSEQLAQLMTAAGKSIFPTRNKAIIALFIGTGIRLSEMYGLQANDVTLCADSSGTALVTGKRTKSNPLGRRAVGFDVVTGCYLTDYLDESRVTIGALWLNDNGDQMSRVSIYRMVKRTIKRAGLTDCIQACHDLRRAFATILGLMHPDSPGWADIIRRQLGHKHYSMTAHYTLIQADDIREWIVSPLSG
jgi:site-specific recombinase XerD